MRPELHLISTGEQSGKQLVEKVKNIHGEVDYIHLREKNWSEIELKDTIQHLIDTGVPKEKIILNTFASIANDYKLKGVQIPSYQNDLSQVRAKFPHLTIGCSVHSVEEAINKEIEGADFLIFGHVFPSASKRGKLPRGLDALQRVVAHVDIPVIAIGGITPERMKEVMQTGVGGIAVLSGILKAEDVGHAANQYSQALEVMM